MFFDHNENKLSESFKSIITAIESDLTMLFRSSNEILSREDFKDTAKRCKIMIDEREKAFLSTSNMYMQFIRARNKHNKLYIKDKGELKLVCLDEKKYKSLPTCKIVHKCPGISNLAATINTWITKGRYDKDVYDDLKKVTSHNSKYMNFYRCAISGATKMREIKSEEFTETLTKIFDLNNPDMVKANFYKKIVKSEQEYDSYMSETYMMGDYIRVRDFIKEVKQNIYTLTEYDVIRKGFPETEQYRFKCNYLTVVTQYYLMILDNIIFAYTLKMETRKKALDDTYERNK